MDSSCSQGNPGLGNLSRLPLEIRLEIWDHFSLDIPGDPFWRDDLNWREDDDWRAELPTKRLAFLRTSKAIYEEASNFVYRKTILSFGTDISTNVSRHTDPVFAISTNGRLYKGFQDHGEALGGGFGQLPLSKFKRIRVVISTPLSKRSLDAVAVAWVHTTYIAELLAQSEHKSAHIHISLEDKRHRTLQASGKCSFLLASDKWRTLPDEGTTSTFPLPLHNIAHWALQPPAMLRPDLFTVLMPLRRLRQFQSVEFDLPKDIQGLQDFASELTRLISRDIPFGAYRDPNNDALDDQNIQQASEKLADQMCMESQHYNNNTAVDCCNFAHMMLFSRSEDHESDRSISEMYYKAKRAHDRQTDSQVGSE